MRNQTMIRAVLFDFGGTLYDYRTLERGNAESLVALARWVGVQAHPELIQRTYRDVMRRVFGLYLPRNYYLHRDLFEEAVVAMLKAFGAAADEEHLTRYRDLQWELQKCDFELRDGVVETLRALQHRCLHLGMVSNIDEDQLASMLTLADVAEHFDSVLSSEYAHSCKPHPGIFSEAVRRAGCRPHEALFVGDSLSQDIAGANRAGLRSVLLWHRDDRDPPDGEPTPHHIIRQLPELLDLVDNSADG